MSQARRRQRKPGLFIVLPLRPWDKAWNRFDRIIYLLANPITVVPPVRKKFWEWNTLGGFFFNSCHFMFYDADSTSLGTLLVWLYITVWIKSSVLIDVNFASRAKKTFFPLYYSDPSYHLLSQREFPGFSSLWGPERFLEAGFPFRHLPDKNCLAKSTPKYTKKSAAYHLSLSVMLHTSQHVADSAGREQSRLKIIWLPPTEILLKISLYFHIRVLDLGCYPIETHWNKRT